jgi:hypothetical protein
MLHHFGFTKKHASALDPMALVVFVCDMKEHMKRRVVFEVPRSILTLLIQVNPHASANFRFLQHVACLVTELDTVTHMMKILLVHRWEQRRNNTIRDLADGVVKSRNKNR